MDEIINYFASRRPSVFVESLNNKIDVLKRRCYRTTDLTHNFNHFISISKNIASSCYGV
jgi:transposase